MKIGLVLEASLAIPGGVQEYTRGLYDLLASYGHEVSIIGAGDKVPEEDSTRKVYLLGKAVEVPDGKLASVPIAWHWPGEIKKFLAREKFDLLHFQAPFGLLAAQVLLASSARVVNVLTFHVYRAKPRLLDKTALPIYQKLNKKIAGRIAVSKAASRYAQNFFPGEYKIIPCGVSLKRFNPVGGRIEKYVNGKLNILFVGRLDPRKGIMYLLRAYQKLEKKFTNLRLIIVGEGPEKKKAGDFVKNHALQDVKFEGQVRSDVLPDYYRTAHIFCAPSYENEALGIVLLEAMASGLPVVGFANAGYKEVLGEGLLSRFLVPPKDNKALTLALGELVEDSSLREKLTALGERKVKSYAWEEVSQQVLKFYRKLVS